MNKAELIDAVASSAAVSKADAERTLGAFFSHVTTAAKKGDRIAWPGFGSFATTRRKARTGRNPQTGAAVKIPASTAMKFTASATLKGNLNAKRAAAKAPAAKKAPARATATATKAAPAKAPAKKAPAAKTGGAKKTTARKSTR